MLIHWSHLRLDNIMARSQEDILKNTDLHYFITKVCVWMLLFCSILLFSPNSILELFYLHVVVENYSHVIGFFILLSLSYLFMVSLGHFLDKGYNYIRDKKLTQSVIAKLKLLNPHERAVLREFFLQRSSVLVMPTNEDSILSLTQAGILSKIRRPSNNTRNRYLDNPSDEYQISLTARKMLTRAQLKLPDSEITEKDFNYLASIRPPFAKLIYRPSKLIRPSKVRRNMGIKR